MIEALTDGRTDTQNFGWYNIIPTQLFLVGHKKSILLPVDKSKIVLTQLSGKKCRP